MGKAESHGGALKLTFYKTALDFPPYTPQDAQRTMLHSYNAKNELLNRGGVSPNQFAFGSNPRLPGALLNEPDQPMAIQALGTSKQAADNELERSAAKKFIEETLGVTAAMPRPSWIEFDPAKKTGKLISAPERNDLPFELNENAIIEFYSQKL